MASAAGAFATPSAAYKMMEVPAAVELILGETEALPAEQVPFQAALGHTLAADVRAAEPVPGFRASIKVGGRAGGRAVRELGIGGATRGPHLACKPAALSHTTRAPCTLCVCPFAHTEQDGYAVLSSDGPGEYEIVFEAFAGRGGWGWGAAYSQCAMKCLQRLQVPAGVRLVPTPAVLTPSS